MNLAPHLRKIFCLMALGAMVLVGCSDDSTGPDGDDPSTLTPPKAGSTFTSTQQNQDEDRAPVGSPVTRTDSLVATNLTVGGKTAVYAFSDGTNTMYYRYEANGDVSVNIKTNYFQLAGDEWYDFAFTTEWFTVPFTTKTSRNDTLAKVQNYGPGSVKVPMSVNAVSDHMGPESVTIGGQAFTAQKAETTINVTIGSLLSKVRVQWSFVPKLGYFSKHDFVIQPNTFFGSSDIYAGGSVSTLTSYSLK